MENDKKQNVNSGHSDNPEKQNFLEVANKLRKQRYQLANDQKTEGVKALKERMDAEGLNIIYLEDCFCPGEVEMCDRMARVIALGGGDLYVYGSDFEMYGDGLDISSEVEKCELLSETNEVYEFIDYIILDNNVFEEAKEKPQDIAEMIEYFTEDSEDDDGEAWDDED